LQQVDDPREFYCQTRILLAPSLWNESFGRVAVEAGLNGIPVVCSNRGALPEVVDGWGIALDVPRRYTPSTRTIPTPDEVAPWADAIATLWNDDVYAQTLARAACERLERYSFQNVADQTATFFNDAALR
jgi:glycosyltransferase involved in cell wall biosynthesis